MDDRELREALTSIDVKVSRLEEYLELLMDPTWKRILYWINGWPYGRPVQCYEQKWRPWHRFWGRRDQCR